MPYGAKGFPTKENFKYCENFKPPPFDLKSSRTREAWHKALQIFCSSKREISSWELKLPRGTPRKVSRIRYFRCSRNWGYQKNRHGSV